MRSEVVRVRQRGYTAQVPALHRAALGLHRGTVAHPGPAQVQASRSLAQPRAGFAQAPREGALPPAWNGSRQHVSLPKHKGSTWFQAHGASLRKTWLSHSFFFTTIGRPIMVNRILWGDSVC